MPNTPENELPIAEIERRIRAPQIAIYGAAKAAVDDHFSMHPVLPGEGTLATSIEDIAKTYDVDRRATAVEIRRRISIGDIVEA
jgi:hypothetical protein